MAWWTRSPVRAGSVGLGGLTLVIVAYVRTATVPDTPPSPFEIVDSFGVAGCMIVAGAAALAWRPGSRVGALLVALGVIDVLPHLYSPEPVTFTLAQLTGPLPIGIAVHLFLAFPNGRLLSRYARVVVGVAYTDVLLSGLGFALTTEWAREGCPACPHNLLLLRDDPALADAIGLAALPVDAFVVVSVVLLLVRRWLHASPPRRRVLAPVLWTSAALVVGLLAQTVAVNLVRSPPVETVLGWYITLAGCALPIGFLTGLLRMRLRRAVVADLLVELESATTVVDVRAALARTLGDPSLELASGPPADPPRPSRGRALFTTEPGPGLVLTYDPALDDDDPALLAAAIAAASLALERLANKAERANQATSAGARGSALSRLSPREREVLTLIAQGLTDRAIAQRLFVTEKTAQAHAQAIFRKLDLPEGPRDNRRVHAVLAYLRS